MIIDKRIKYTPKYDIIDLYEVWDLKVARLIRVHPIGFVAVEFEIIKIFFDIIKILP